MLTKDADKLLTAMYREYRSRRKAGFPRDAAAEFEPSSWGGKAPFSSWIPGDLESAVHELSSSGMISEDILGYIELKQGAIADLENANIERLEKLFDKTSEIIGLVSSIAQL